MELISLEITNKILIKENAFVLSNNFFVLSFDQRIFNDVFIIKNAGRMAAEWKLKCLIWSLNQMSNNIQNWFVCACDIFFGHFVLVSDVFHSLKPMSVCIIDNGDLKYLLKLKWNNNKL